MMLSPAVPIQLLALIVDVRCEYLKLRTCIVNIACKVILQCKSCNHTVGIVYNRQNAIWVL